MLKDRRQFEETVAALSLVDRLQLFARLETHSLAGRDADFGAGARVASDAGFARTNVEDAETSELDAITQRQSLLHALKDGFHRHFSFGFGDASLVYDFVDDIEFDHYQLRRRFWRRAI